MKAVLRLAVLLLASPVVLWAQAPPEAPDAPPSLDPRALVLTDCWATEYMTTHRPLGTTGADLGNFLGGTWGHVLLGVAVWQSGDRIGPQFRQQMEQALVTNALLTGSLKRLVGRRRPDRSTRTSWPSGHTSSAVAALTVLDAHLPGRAVTRLPLVALGATVALSRVQHRRHWLSDTIAGAALGYACGRVACGRGTETELAATAGAVFALGELVARTEADRTPSAAAPPVAKAGTGKTGDMTFTVWSTTF